MGRSHVQLISTDNQENSITISVDGVRIEYFLGDRYHHTLLEVKDWLNAGWTNYVVSQLTRRAREIRTSASFTSPPFANRKANMSTSIDNQKTPSKEYSWTVIAPTARNGLTYQGQRLWFKAEEDARKFAADIFEGADKKNFDLCIVECKDVVSVKPQVELSSRW